MTETMLASLATLKEARRVARRACIQWGNDHGVIPPAEFYATYDAAAAAYKSMLRSCRRAGLV